MEIPSQSLIREHFYAIPFYAGAYVWDGCQ